MVPPSRPTDGEVCEIADTPVTKKCAAQTNNYRIFCPSLLGSAQDLPISVEVVTNPQDGLVVVEHLYRRYDSGVFRVRERPFISTEVMNVCLKHVLTRLGSKYLRFGP